MALAVAVPPKARAPEDARRLSGPIQITVGQDELIATFMDLDALGWEGVEEVAAALLAVGAYMPEGMASSAVQARLGDVYAALMRVVATARMGTARYESAAGPRR